MVSPRGQNRKAQEAVGLHRECMLIYSTSNFAGYPYSRKNGIFEVHGEASDNYYSNRPLAKAAKEVQKSAQDIFAGLWPQLNSSWDFYRMASIDYSIRNKARTNCHSNGTYSSCKR